VKDSRRRARGGLQRLGRVRDAPRRRANGWLDLERTVRETLLSIRRAGADLIVTYHARDLADALD
jgi:hypothetical protein